MCKCGILRATCEGSGAGMRSQVNVSELNFCLAEVTPMLVWSWIVQSGFIANSVSLLFLLLSSLDYWRRTSCM